MDQYYRNYHKQAVDLQYHFQDVVDNHADPRMQSLHREVHALAQDIESNKHPRSIEDRLKIIDHQLVQARSAGGQLMSYNDIDGMQHSYRKMREDIRRLPNY
jgi:hypothetical protein